MDFFEAQDESRRNTKLLVIFFVLAVLSIVLLTNLLLFAVWQFSDTARMAQSPFSYSWETILTVSVVVVAFIGLGSLYRIWSLSGGGESVAGMMGGKLVVDHGGDLRLRRLLNVVEEMAIASGTPVPPVYILEDDAINAFAAGYSPGDAVIGITRGAIENLDRDQLQGVIAHEFSHILNGDMRLNIRLMGVLFGILMLAVIGRILLSPGRVYAIGGSRRNNGAGVAVLALGVGLVVIGFIGKFFGSVIKAGVSRQREFLADASAVQFTRNPQGIGGALMRIGGYPAGSVVDNPEAEELSHAFFSEGVTTMFTRVMATHPPLKQRIARINPDWDGSFITEPPPAPSTSEFGEGQVSAMAPQAGSGSIDTEAALASIGQPEAAQLQQARDVLGAIPAALADAAREAYSARAVVYLVLLDRDPLVSSRQQDHLQDAADVFVLARFRELLPLATEITPEMRLPLLELAMPSLRQLSRDQYDRFLANVDALIRADNRIVLSEWALRKYLFHNLEAAFDRKRSTPRHDSLEEVASECAALLSMLSYSDGDAAVPAEVAFEAGRRELELDIALAQKSELQLSRLNDAVDTLADLRPLRKPKLLKACIATITADRVVAPVEKELVRAIADALDCPMPPIR